MGQEEGIMIIVVSGEKKEVKDNLTLPELIAQENVEMPEYITVSINEEFVPSDEKETTVLKEEYIKASPTSKSLASLILPS